MATYTLHDHGADLVVETWTESGKKPNRARLLLDGAQIDAGQADEIGDVRLGREAGHHTKVAWWWKGRVAGVALVEQGALEERHRRVPYAPPPGTRAARVHAWSQAHPRLWATRHVLVWGLGAVATLLGINLLIRLLTSWVSFGWLPDLPTLPSIPWPDAPGWWTAAWGWIGETITTVIELLVGWIPDEPWIKYVVGGVVAVGIAVREARRRERRRGPGPSDERR